MRARLAAVVTAAVLAVVGCDDPFADDPAPKESAPSAHRSEGSRNPAPNAPPPKTPEPNSPIPDPPPPSPEPWVPKGPATLTGCGTHASGYQCSFHGYNFKPGEKVRLTRGVQSVGGNVFIADENGEFSTNLISSTPSGTYTYVAHGQESNRQAGTEVRITPGLWG
ncbi:hypothetical protein ACF08N_33450 [Streptomyces sp. NPDC015127]|uniref:hypothetical protein n=1 Tax=Streptomyces sp. NPDC015127 TaxID=3364939 RepID=UPI0036F6E504